MKRFKIPLNFILIVYLLCSAQIAGSQVIFDLSQYIKTGLERNFSLQVVRNKSEIADLNFTKGNAGFLPTITTTNRVGGTVNNTDQSLRDGGNSSANGIHNISGSAGISLGMTIFKGFSVQTTYKKLGELKNMGELNTQMAVENLVSDMVSEYYYYLQQINLYKNLAYAVSLSKERLRIDETRYVLGASSKLQLLQSRVYLNSDSSRLSKQNEVLRAAQIRLNELIASENLGENIVLKDSLIQINSELNYEELFQSTLERNTSLWIAAKNQVISELDYKIIKSASYPYLTFSSGLNYSYNGYETGSIKNQQIKGMNYGLTFGMDIFDGFNLRREKTNAKIEIKNRQFQYQEVEQSVKADLLTISYAYQNNLRLLKLENQNLEVARENLDIAMERYKLGNLSGLDLREVQKSLLDAEERLISIQFQTKLAEISLLQVAGKIMEYLN